MRHCAQLFQNRLDIRQVIYEVGKEDVVELFRRGEFRRVGDAELELRLPLACQFNHFRAEIHAYAACRFHRGQQVSQAATDLEDPLSSRNEESVIFTEETLIETAGLARSKRGTLVVERSAVNHRAKLVKENGVSGERKCTVCGNPANCGIELQQGFDTFPVVTGNSTASAPPANPDEWFTPTRFALLLGLLICATYPEVIIGTKTFFHRDFALFGYPLAAYHRECFWHCKLPLWTPLSYCGLPFLAQWNTMTLYPLSLFYLLLPLSWSLGVFCLGHLFLGGGWACICSRIVGRRIVWRRASRVWRSSSTPSCCIR